MVKPYQILGEIKPDLQDALQRLAAYAIQVRYPSEDLTAEKARLALKTGQEVRRFSSRLLGAAT